MSSNQINYKLKILQELEDSAFGLTITEISKKTGFHRNTVSKYVKILESENLVRMKGISAAHVYFSQKRKHLRKSIVISFLKALVAGLKDKFPNQERQFKEIGWKILEYFQFPIGKAYQKEFQRARKNSDSLSQLRLYKQFYNAFDFFQDDIDIEEIRIQQQKIEYKIKNSKFLGNSEEFLYFFYIACGITEKIFLQNLGLDVSSTIEDIYISPNPKQSYIIISIEIH